ncbi:MAG: glycerophosphodiester phosphodiesterase family protein [Pseudolysinimonas sp.]|uniref:glycerophosphodiester phosphodiesterase family protein n=1 Tax=Pseudolysinimonas sp. TaxID=2680009 RepID=UPI0032630449
MSTPRPLVIGHRGACGYRPEHTRAAYELAIDLGADAIEPDIVASRDGVLVLRHENEISGTTDVARHPEFADRRVTKTIDGGTLTGWFTEDFTWAELSTLRARERLPDLRPGAAAFDGAEPILRLSDLLDILDAGAERSGRPISIVAEVKHPSYFASIGIPLDRRVAEELRAWDDGDRIIVECFEQSLLGQVRERGVGGRYVYLLEAPDASRLTTEALIALGSGVDGSGVDGVSVDKAVLLDAGGPALVERAHDAGLSVFTWTLRPENAFLATRHRGAGSPAERGDWRAEFAELLATGVDGVFADHPDLAADARAAVGRET